MHVFDGFSLGVDGAEGGVFFDGCSCFWHILEDDMSCGISVDVGLEDMGMWRGWDGLWGVEDFESLWH